MPDTIDRLTAVLSDRTAILHSPHKHVTEPTTLLGSGA